MKSKWHIVNELRMQQDQPALRVNVVEVQCIVVDADKNIVQFI
jgi:hypothetical protein